MSSVPFYAKSADNQGYIKNLEVLAYDDLDGGSIFQPQLYRTPEGGYEVHVLLQSDCGPEGVTAADLCDLVIACAEIEIA